MFVLLRSRDDIIFSGIAGSNELISPVVISTIFLEKSV